MVGKKQIHKHQIKCNWKQGEKFNTFFLRGFLRKDLGNSEKKSFPKFCKVEERNADSGESSWAWGEGRKNRPDSPVH